jgi:hypothetical protein
MSASVITNLIVAVAALIVFLSLGAAIAFLFFGYLAYLADFEDMPHDDEVRT